MDKLNRQSGFWNRTNRSGLNKNWDILEGNNLELEKKIQQAYDKAQSSYELWLEAGNAGTLQDFFDSLKVKGDPFTFEDFTPEQIESLKVKGDPFTFEDFTPEQIEALKVKGDPFTYSDFTAQQLEGLKVKGDTGESAYQLWLKQPGNAGKSLQEYLASLKGEKGDGLQIDGVVATVGELPTGTTKSTYLVGTTLYFRQAGSNTWTKGVDIKGVDGKAGSVVTIVDGYWAIDGVKTETLADATQTLKYDARNYIMQSNIKETGLPASWLVLNGAGHTGTKAIADDARFTKVYKHQMNTIANSSTAPYSITVLKTSEKIPENIDATFVAWMKADANTTLERISFSNELGTQSSTAKVNIPLTTEWQLVTYTGKAIAGKYIGGVYIGVARGETAQSFYIAEPMLVKGVTAPLSYFPAFEDTLSQLKGFAPMTHTHTISQVTGLQNALDGKITKAQADTYYMPANGSATPYNVLTYIDVVAKFGLKDTSLPENSTFDNYDGIKAWAIHVNTNSGYDYYVDPRVKEIRSRKFRQVDNEQNTLSGTPDDIIWTGKNFRIFGNGVKFVSMPTEGFQRGFDYVVGDYYRSKNCHLNLFKFVGAENFSIEGLIVDGESQKITFPATATQTENANIKYNGKTLAETHGHMIEFSGCKFFDVKRSKFLNASVDCVNISSLMDLATFKATHTDFFTFDECVFSGGGRLSFAMIGGVNFEITRSEFTNAGTIKNSQGKQIFYSPAMGADFEPHFSEIAGDNDTASKWRSDKWNGHAKIRQCLFNNNAGGGVACTSTLLTKLMSFEQNVFKPGTAGKGNYYMINSSLRLCDFINNDFRGGMVDGNYSKIIPFGAGLVNEQTGVINGEPSNATTNFIGNTFEKCDFWTNYDTTQTYNDVPTGQYGLHRVHFERNNFLDCLVQYKNRRQFTYINNVFNWTATENKTTKILMRNSILKDNIFKSDKSTAITLDFGSGDQLSVIENLMTQVGKFLIDSTSKATKVKTRTDENLDIYYQTPLMDYLLVNGGTGGTPTPGDTTPPNAPTVNAVYANSTTITGTAEANSTVLFTGGFTGQTTANSSGAFTIVASGLVAGQTITVKAKDAAGNTSTGTTITIQAAQTGTGGNLWPTTSFDLTNKTIPQLGGSGSKYAINSAYTISNNEAQPLNMTGSGDTVTINATAETAKYGFFTLEPNTQYTLRIKASDTIANANDLVTMLGGEYIWPNPRVLDITFTTDSAGKYGYDFNGVTYGAADATKGLFHRANGGKNSVTTYKMWLNKGATSTATWSS